LAGEFVTLSSVTFRKDESKILAQKLLINNVVEDLTGWTIELYAEGTKIKTITLSSNQATQGIIRNQTTNKGEYFFTLLSADLTSLIGSVPERRLISYVRYITTDVSPPRTFSNVEFVLIIKA